jgi:very-short-patch-repair endonuclease
MLHEFVGFGQNGPMIQSSTEQARELRREQTRAEEALWELLRDRQILHLKFRRQCPLNRYIADFCCKDPRIIVELDGEVHDDLAQQAHDENRDHYLRSLNYAVLRFRNRQVFEEPATVIATIARTALQLQPSLCHRR